MNMLDVRPPDAEEARASSRAGRRRWLFWSLAILLSLAAAGAVLWQRGTAPPPQVAAPTATPVLTVPLIAAITRPLEVPVVGDGTVAAWQELALGAEIGGLRVLEVRVEEGVRVVAGDLLVRLDDSVLAAQSAQAEASVTEARATLDLARSEVARAQTLASTNIGPRQVLEQRQAAAAQAEARLASAIARRDEAQARLAQAQILAPTDGLVSRVTVRIGTVTGAGQEMLRLVRDGRLELNARIPELDLGGIAPGQAVLVRHGGQEIRARVRAIAPTVTPESRLGLVHVALPADSSLLPGMFARAEIMGPARPAVLVPAGAVVFREGAPAVFTLAPGEERVRLRRLTLGTRADGLVEVLDGLAAGERVVASGAGFLADGDLVRAAPPGASAP
jgi:RND family efflux transporter MFP subunit